MGFGSGLSLSSNVLTMDMNRVRSHLPEGEYYWMLYKNDYGRPWIEGISTGHHGLLPTIEDSTAVTVDEGGYALTVTINESAPVIITSTINHARGDWAGTTALPATGGTLTSGAPQQGNRWRLTGTLSIGGNIYQPGTMIEAAVDTPGQTLTNWIFYAVQL
jgi:hypothetical protein